MRVSPNPNPSLANRHIASGKAVVPNRWGLPRRAINVERSISARVCEVERGARGCQSTPTNAYPGVALAQKKLWPRHSKNTAWTGALDRAQPCARPARIGS